MKGHRMAKKADSERKTRTAKAKEARKPGFTSLTDDERQKLFFKHERDLAPILSREALVKAELKKVYANAKADGFHKFEFQYSRQFATPEGEAEIAAKQEALYRIARWKGVALGTQADLFAEQDIRRDEHFEEGKRANFAGQPRKAPAHLNIADSDRWYAGFDHASEVNLERAADPSTGFRPIGDVAKGTVEAAAH
jgi:hypothetical protein